MPVTSATFIRTTLLLLVVGFVAVLAIVGASLGLAGSSDIFAARLAEDMRIRREAFTVMALIQRAESSQRGYLLTQDERYLGPYHQAIAEIDKEIGELSQDILPRPQLAVNANALIEAIGRKRAELAQTIDLARAGRVDDALAIVGSDAGETAMTTIRRRGAELVEASDALITINTADLRASAGWLVWVLAAGGFVILSVVGGASWVAWRYTRDLERARNEVIGLNTTLEARVRERTADVARANEEIQRFAYIVSHDLRSPLVNIMGFTSELEESLKDLSALIDKSPSAGAESEFRRAESAVKDDMPEAISFIRSSTTKMDSLINAILRLSREGQRRLTSQRIDMRQLLQQAAGSVQHQLGQGAGEIVVQQDIPEIVSDRLAVEQIFGNLVDNSVKYLQNGRPGRIEIRARDTSMGVEFEVADNGRGIAPEDHERIFDLFRRAGEQDRPGEGIGLSHVRALVRRLGGTISLQSELGTGTTFRVRLPQTLPLLRERA